MAKKEKKTQLVKQEYSDAEQRCIDVFRQKRKEQHQPQLKADGENIIISDTLTYAYAAEACGSTQDAIIKVFLEQAIKSTSFATSKAEQGNYVLALLSGIKPRDELEGILAVQMVAVHNLAMNFMASANFAEQTFDGRNANVAWATKLLRTFTAQIEALNRYRGGGQQKVVVEHVHVNEGGQAIVGNVEGGGANAKKCG